MPSDDKPVIGFICGSLRDGSINKQLEGALIKRFARANAATLSIDLGAYDLPLFHGDINTPTEVKALSGQLSSCDGLIVISPEYNGGLPPVLKNAIDWISTLGTAQFEKPYWGIASCTPGPMSGIMCMRQVNYILTRLGAHTSPFQVGVGNASAAFDAKGELISQPATSIAEKLVSDMLDHI